MNQRNIHEMTKAIVNQGINGADTMRKLGKLEFVVSVQRTFFTFQEFLI